MKKIRLIGFVAIIAFLQLSSFFYSVAVHAANLTAAKNTLQSSRMSFNGRVRLLQLPVVLMSGYIPQLVEMLLRFLLQDSSQETQSQLVQTTTL